MNEILALKEIEERYPDEWILIGDPETDESLEGLSGTVLYHGESREEMLRVAKDLQSPKRFATHYTGELFPEHVAYSLNWGLPGRLGLSADEWEQVFEEPTVPMPPPARTIERS